jgi:hypothetical protein
VSGNADREHRRPRWVTVAYAVALVLVVLLVVLWLVGGSHGPGRHLSSPGPQSAPVALVPVDG